MYLDALRIYEHLTETGKYNFATKVMNLKAKLNPEHIVEDEEVSLTKIVLSNEEKQNRDGIIFEVNAPSEADKDEVGEEKQVILPEYNSLINILFNDEEKNYFQIVPSEEFYYNKNKELVSIFTKKEKGQSYYPVGDDMNEKPKEDYHEILNESEDINTEVTVEDFVNILYTYYNKDTKISEIKIGDLFLLLSSIKIENS